MIKGCQSILVHRIGLWRKAKQAKKGNKNKNKNKKTKTKNKKTKTKNKK
jgi:hypothetical protein